MRSGPLPPASRAIQAVPGIGAGSHGCVAVKLFQKGGVLRVESSQSAMKLLIAILLWAILLAVCWPLALLFIAVWPILWLLSIPFRFLALVVEAGFALAAVILLLPARRLGLRDL